jgi:uncharacterized protein
VIRATPDTNILVSAIIFGGRAGEPLERAINREVELVISPAIADEVCGVLREKFGFSDERVLDAWERMLDACRMLTERPPEVRAVPDDPDDDMVVACAVEAKAQVIISGDRHLLDLGSYRDVRVVKLSEFLAGPQIER